MIRFKVKNNVVFFYVNRVQSFWPFSDDLIIPSLTLRNLNEVGSRLGKAKFKVVFSNAVNNVITFDNY